MLEKAKEAIDEDKAEDLGKRFLKGEFNLIVWSKSPPSDYKRQLKEAGFEYQRLTELSDRSMITGKGNKEVIEQYDVGKLAKRFAIIFDELIDRQS